MDVRTCHGGGWEWSGGQGRLLGGEGAVEGLTQDGGCL